MDYLYKFSTFCYVIIIIITIIIIFLHGLGRLNCSAIDVAIVSWGVHDFFFLWVCS
jgi:hypothetical protein